MLSRDSLSAGSVAGAATIASAVLTVATIAIWSTGGTVGLGTIGVPPGGGLVLLAAIVFGIAGFATTALVGPRPLDGRATRAGLLVIALGLTGVFVSSLISAMLTYDPLESWPAVISLLTGLLGLAVGAPVALLGLLATRGAPRRLAVLFLAGLLLAGVGGNVVGSLLMRGAIHDDGRPLLAAGIAVLVIGAASMITAFAGIGWLAFVGGRRPASVP